MFLFKRKKKVSLKEAVVHLQNSYALLHKYDKIVSKFCKIPILYMKAEAEKLLDLRLTALND